MNGQGVATPKPLATRGTTNRNARGGTPARRARRAWLLRTFDLDLGQYACRCYRCHCDLIETTVTADRIMPGAHGGTYRRSNIRPACSRCNSETGGAVRAGKPIDDSAFVVPSQRVSTENAQH